MCDFLLYKGDCNVFLNLVKMHEIVNADLGGMPHLHGEGIFK